eukprot:gene5277-3782_t
MLPQKEEELRKQRIARRNQDLQTLFDTVLQKRTAGYESGGHSRGRRGDKQRSGGGGVLITSDGRTIVLSAESRRLPPAFTDLRRTLRNAEQQLTLVTSTVTELGTAFSSGSQIQLPAETVIAVEDSHREYLNMLARSKPETFSKQIGSAKAARDPESEEEWNMNVLRARAAAADEGFTDDQSVEDYAVTDFPEVVNADSTIREKITAMTDSLAKVEACAKRIIQIEQSSDMQWWSSAARTRVIKANSVRANYHCRLAYRYNLSAREQFFLQASYLNIHSEQCRTDLVKLQQQLAMFEGRTVESKQQLIEVGTHIEELSEKLQAANERRLALQEELNDKAHQLNIVYPGDRDAVNAELALLLKYSKWPKELVPDVKKVLQWIQSEPCTLE